LDETSRALKGAGDLGGELAKHIEAAPKFAALGAVGPDLLYYTETSTKLVSAVASIYSAINSLTSILERFAGLAKDAGMPNSAERLNQLAHVAELDFKSVESMLTSALVALNNEVNGTILTPSKIQQDSPETDWKWGDLLHWRGADFADYLFDSAQNSKTSVFIAYALGYKTHVAADTVGHAYVNQVVGGPSRAFPMRHHVAENFMDAHAYRNRGLSINTAKLHERMPLSDLHNIIVPFIKPGLQWLVDRSAAPNKLPAPPDDDKLYSAISAMLNLFRYVTEENFAPPPQPPGIRIPPLPFQHGSATDALRKAMPAPSKNPTLADILKALLLVLAMVPAFLVDIARIAADIAIGLSTYPAAAAIYVGHLFIYWVYRQIRWFLVVAGVAFPMHDEIETSLGRQFIPCRVPVNEDFPRREPRVRSWQERVISHLGRDFVIDANDLDYLRYPSTERELVERVASPYGSDATPEHFINGISADAKYIASWETIGDPADLNSLNKSSGFADHISPTTPLIAGFGNAVELSKSYILGDIRFGKINLDADRGYGQLNWTCSGGISQGYIQGEKFI